MASPFIRFRGRGAQFCHQGDNKHTSKRDNLRRWGKGAVDETCSLCGSLATLRHILNSCKVALHQGRFTYRRDSVLAVLKKNLLKFYSKIKTEKRPTANSPIINFVRAGEAKKPKTQRRPLLYGDALRCATDWEFQFDLDTNVIFPPEAAVTKLRPDIVIYSRSLRTIIILELTVPHEDNIGKAHERKLNRYASLLAKCEQNGYKTMYFPVEVGSRGFVSLKTNKCLEILGMSTAEAKRTRLELSRTAQRASYIIFRRKDIEAWPKQMGLLC